MRYEIAKLNAQQFANERCKPVYITKVDKKNDYQIVFDKLGLTIKCSIVETVAPTTREYLQITVNKKIEDVINEIKLLTIYEINGQLNYFNASDVMDIVMQLRRLQN